MNNYDENFNFYIILSEKNASIFILLKTRMKHEIRDFCVSFYTFKFSN